jgi:cysteine dioxygenase
MEEDTSLCSGVTWTQLQSEIRKIFAEDSINIDDVKRLLKSYTSNQEDWNQHVKFDVHSYTRNLVDSGNEKYNLLVLCWSEGHGRYITRDVLHNILSTLSNTLILRQ